MASLTLQPSGGIFREFASEANPAEKWTRIMYVNTFDMKSPIFDKLVPNSTYINQTLKRTHEVSSLYLVQTQKMLHQLHSLLIFTFLRRFLKIPSTPFSSTCGTFSTTTKHQW